MDLRFSFRFNILRVLWRDSDRQLPRQDEEPRTDGRREELERSSEILYGDETGAKLADLELRAISLRFQEAAALRLDVGLAAERLLAEMPDRTASRSRRRSAGASPLLHPAVEAGARTSPGSRSGR